MPHIPEFAGQLALTVVSAHRLAAKENKADPYVVVTVVSPSNAHTPETHNKTKTIKRSTSPEWGEAFSFFFGVPKGKDDVLRLEVWDFNSVRHDKFMGLADFKLSDLVEGEETQTELPLKEHEGKHKKETVSGTITIKATLKQDYHKQRAERAAKLEHDAELKRQEEELATKKQQEEDEKLISQVHLSHEGAMGLVRAFHKSAKEDTITRASLKSVFEGLDSLSQDAIIAQVGEPDTLFDFLDLNHDGERACISLLFFSAFCSNKSLVSLLLMGKQWIFVKCCLVSQH